MISNLAIQLLRSSTVRLLTVAGSAGTAGALLYWPAGTQIHGFPIWLVAGLLYAAAIGSSSAFIFIFLPRLRQFVELTAVSRLTLALISVWSPEFATTLTTSPFLNATLVVAGAVLIRTTGQAYFVPSKAIVAVRSW